MKIVQRLFTLSTFVIGITAASATPITGIVADAQTGEASMERLLRLRHDQPRHGKRLMIQLSHAMLAKKILLRSVTLV